MSGGDLRTLKARATGGDRVTWSLTSTAKCIDCGAPIVHFNNGRLRVDLRPHRDGTVLVTVGRSGLNAKRAQAGDVGPKFAEHTRTCERRTAPAEPIEPVTTIARAAVLVELPIEDLDVGSNIRDDVGDITGLAESIRIMGVLEPIVIWPSEDGTRLEVGMGQRRLAAAKLAGLRTVPCMQRTNRPDERDRILMQLAENHERAAMTPIDEAHAFAELIALGISRRAIARSVRMSEDWVYKRTKLLEFPAVLRAAVHAGTVTPSAALEYPLALAVDRDATRRLEQLGELNDSRLRAFIKDEVGRARPGAPIERRGVRVVPVSIDNYEAARARAKHMRVTLGAYVDSLIEKDLLSAGKVA